MNKELQDTFSQPSGEIIVGLVGAVGTDLDVVTTAVKDRLRHHFDYTGQIIRVSKLLEERIADGSFTPKHSVDKATQYLRISTLMDAGNDARAKAKDGSALAYLVVADIAREREAAGSKLKPLTRTAFIVRSLKHPQEAVLLRQVYGRGFFLLGVHAPRDQRMEHLVNDLLMSDTEANDLVARDQAEDDGLGQQAGETFVQCDAFISLHRSEWKDDLNRIIDLIFGHPYLTPTPDEHAMFLAYASSLRSADLSRQVGAVIVNRSGDIISTGANEVPCFGGGLYWSTSTLPNRDVELKHDPNQKRRDEIAAEIIVAAQKATEATQPLLTLNDLEPTGVLEITEFGRTIHAEMEALMSCARSGNSPMGGRLFCTTFPCHNCAKHIVAAGIREVVYVEPYPKSKAEDLYPKEIDARSAKAPRDRVWFRPFFGVSPRRYFDLFSMTLSQGYPLKRKNIDGTTINWNPKSQAIRFPVANLSFLKRESLAASQVKLFLEVPGHDTGKR